MLALLLLFQVVGAAAGDLGCAADRVAAHRLY
jgi:hypothetical protein